MRDSSVGFDCRLSWALLLLLAFVTMASAGTAETGAATQVHGFYQWYVHELNHDDRADPGKSPAIHRYVSDAFLRRIVQMEKHSGLDGGGLESDPYILAQDWDRDWEKNIMIGNVKKEGSAWTVPVTLSGHKMPAQHLLVTVVEENGSFKIDRIKGLNK